MSNIPNSQKSLFFKYFFSEPKVINLLNCSEADNDCMSAINSLSDKLSDILNRYRYDSEDKAISAISSVVKITTSKGTQERTRKDEIIYHFKYDEEPMCYSHKGYSIKFIIRNALTKNSSDITRKCRDKLISVALFVFCEENQLLENEFFSLFQTPLDFYTYIFDKKETISDVRLSYYIGRDISFLDQDDFCRYLYGTTEKAEIKKVISEKWPNVKVEDSDVKSSAEVIIKEAIKHPLISFLFQEKYEEQRELKKLLQITTVYNNKEASIDFAISNVVQNLTHMIIDIICPDIEISPYDFMIVLGRIAAMASSCENYYFDLENIDEVFCGYQRYKNEIIQSITEHASFNSDVKLFEKSGEKYRFYTTYTRLVFHAIYLAHSYFFSTEINKDEIFLKKIFDLVKISNERTDLIHIDNRFDYIILVGYVFITSLSLQEQESFIKYLCDCSSDFSVKHRKEQIACIYILSYLLCEKMKLTTELRNNIFLKTYGKTSYNLQYLQWNMLCNTSKSYRCEIEERYEKSITLSKNKTFTEEQPYYFFLYDYVEKEFPYSAAFSLRKDTWENDISAKNFTDRAQEVLGKCYEIFNKCKTRTDMKLAYAVQALLYAIANFVNNGFVDPRNFFKDFLQTNIEKIIELMFYSDYCIRKYNKYYSQEYYFSFSENSDENIAEQSFDMYLLCGAFRFVCSINLHPILNDSKYIMSKEMKNDYRFWLKNEKGRYKMLMAYLVSHSDFDRNTIYEFIKGNHNDNIAFLPYDNLKAEYIFKSEEKIEDIVSWWQ